MQIGDKVKYLNDVGGGIITRFQSRNVVIVEQEDGFEVPVLKAECIVIESAAQSKAKPKAQPTAQPDDYNYKPLNADDNVDENLLFAIVSQDKKNITPSLDVFIINLSNYFRYYTVNEVRGDKYILIDKGELEPNTKVRVDSIATSEMGNKTEFVIQLLSYNNGTTYMPQGPIEKSIFLKPQKLIHLGSYKKTKFFSEPAITYSILADDLNSDLEKLVAKHSSQEKREFSNPKKKRSRIETEVIKNGIVEVDLHIHELLDDTSGMNNADMLNYQMEVFNKKIGQYRDKKGQKIAFIHGKGNGVLKNEILRTLKREVKLDYYDASFQQYGFGATMVVIR